jgi:hypothetical protein
MKTPDVAPRKYTILRRMCVAGDPVNIEKRLARFKEIPLSFVISNSVDRQTHRRIDAIKRSLPERFERADQMRQNTCRGRTQVSQWQRTTCSPRLADGQDGLAEVHGELSAKKTRQDRLNNYPRLVTESLAPHRSKIAKQPHAK